MTRHIDTQQRRRRLALRHRLVPAQRTNDVAEITESLVALHSSDPATVYLSAMARMVDPCVAGIDSALYVDRSIVRHHAMRRTMWVFPRDLVPAAHQAATAKVAIREHQRLLEWIAAVDTIGDAEHWLADGLDTVVEVASTADGDEPGITARELGRLRPDLAIKVLAGAGTRNQAQLNAHPRLLQLAGFHGRLLRSRPTGGWTNAEYRWVEATSWLGHPIVRDPDTADPPDTAEVAAAAAVMLGRWLERFGPATLTDIRWWFGWTAAMSRQALADIGAVDVTVDEFGPAFVCREDDGDVDDPGPWVALLPGLDPTSMGWKQRNWYLPDALVPDVVDRAGNIGPTIWADGEIVGGWTQAPDGQVLIEITRPLDAAHVDVLDHELQRLAIALGDTVVKPRFPSPNQRRMLERSVPGRP